MPWELGLLLILLLKRTRLNQMLREILQLAAAHKPCSGSEHVMMKVAISYQICQSLSYKTLSRINK